MTTQTDRERQPSDVRSPGKTEELPETSSQCSHTRIAETDNNSSGEGCVPAVTRPAEKSDGMVLVNELNTPGLREDVTTTSRQE